MESDGPVPQISVAMSAFNAARFIGAAIESVLAQTFSDFEFLILDDGSTDDTLAIAHAYAAQDPRLRVIAGERRGLVDSLNRLLGEARAPLIARFDADDLCRADRLEKQVVALQTDPQIGVVGSFAQPIDDAGDAIRRLAFALPYEHSAIVEALEHWSPIYHSAAMFRRALVLDHGGYRKVARHSEDYDLWLRLAPVTRFANIAENLISYRVHPDQLSEREMVFQARSAAIVWLAHRERQAGRPDPLEGRDRLPGDDEIEALFGKDAPGIIRERVFDPILGSTNTMLRDGAKVALKHSTGPADRAKMWRMAYLMLRLRRPLAAGLFALGISWQVLWRRGGKGA